MKKIIPALLIGLFSTGVWAADGTITINGKILDQTCNITTGTSGNFAVDLQPVRASQLDTVGKTAGSTPFNITLTGCKDISKTVYAVFETGNAAGRLDVNETPKVHIEVLNGSTAIPVGKPWAEQKAAGPKATLGSGSATLNYVARYYANDVVDYQGNVTASVQYTLAYE